MAASNNPQIYQPDLKIPQLPYLQPDNPLNGAWWGLGYDDETETTYKIQFQVLAEVLSASAVRFIPYADFRNDYLDDGQMKYGRLSILTNRPNGQTNDGPVLIAVKELGDYGIEPLAIQIMPETALGGGEVSIGTYIVGNDTFKVLGAGDATSITHAAAYAATTSPAGDLLPGTLYAIKDRPNGGPSNLRMYIRAIDTRRFEPLGMLETATGGSMEAVFYAISGDNAKSIISTINSRFARYVTYADLANDLGDDALVDGRLSFITERPNGNGPGGVKYIVAVREFNLVELGQTRLEKLAHLITAQPNSGGYTVSLGTYEYGSDAFTEFEYYHLARFFRYISYADFSNDVNDELLAEGRLSIITNRPNGAVPGFPDGVKWIAVKELGGRLFDPLATEIIFTGNVGAVTPTGVPCRYTFGTDTTEPLDFHRRNTDSGTNAEAWGWTGQATSQDQGEQGYLETFAVPGRVLARRVLWQDAGNNPVARFQRCDNYTGTGADVWKEYGHEQNTDTGTNAAVWAWIGQADNQEQGEVAYVETFALSSRTVARRLLLQDADNNPVAKFQRCSNYTGTGADVWEDFGGAGGAEALTYAAFAAKRDASELILGRFYVLTALPSLGAQQVITQAISSTATNQLSVMSAADGGGQQRVMFFSATGVVNSYNAETMAHFRNMDYASNTLVWQWTYYANSQDQGALYYVQTFLRPDGTTSAKRVKVTTAASGHAPYSEEVCNEYTGLNTDVWEAFPPVPDTPPPSGGAASVQVVSGSDFTRYLKRLSWFSIYFENGKLPPGESVNLQYETFNEAGNIVGSEYFVFQTLNDMTNVEPWDGSYGNFIANTRLDSAHSNMEAARGFLRAVRASPMNDTFFVFLGEPGDKSRAAVYIVSRQPASSVTDSYEGRMALNGNASGTASPGVGVWSSADYSAEGVESFEVVPGQWYAYLPDGEEEAPDNINAIRFQCLGLPLLLGPAYRYTSEGDERRQPGEELPGGEATRVRFNWSNQAVTPILPEAHFPIPELEVIRHIYGEAEAGTYGAGIPPLIGAPPMAQLKFRWMGGSPEFLKFNPEIWLYVWNNSTKSWTKQNDLGANIDKRTRTAKWRHPVHQDGSRHPGSGFFSGSRQNADANAGLLIMPPLDTEFVPDFHTWTQKGYHIQSFDLTNWFAKYDRQTGALLTDNINIVGKKYRSARIRFAIVIDAPPGYRGPFYGGKVRGPLSEEFRIFARKAAYFNSGAPEYVKMIDKAH